MQQELKHSIEQLCKALREDPEYYHSWQANIAMAVVDEYWEDGETSLDNYCPIHSIANKAAKRFLNQLIHEKEDRIQDREQGDIPQVEAGQSTA